MIRTNRIRNSNSLNRECEVDTKYGMYVLIRGDAQPCRAEPRAVKLRRCSSAEPKGPAVSKPAPAVEEAFAEVALHRAIRPCLSPIRVKQRRLRAARRRLLPERLTRAADLLEAWTALCAGRADASNTAHILRGGGGGIAAEYAPRRAPQVALHDVLPHEAAAQAASPRAALRLRGMLGLVASW